MQQVWRATGWAPLLELKTGERVLEIGSGHGRTLGRLAKRHPRCEIIGVDHSRLMVWMARRANPEMRARGRIKVLPARSDQIPLPDASCDAVLAVHVVYFWRDPAPHLRECRRMLRSGRRLLLGFHRPTNEQRRNFPGPIYTHRDANEIVCALEAAGFETTRTGTENKGSGPIDWTLSR